MAVFIYDQKGRTGIDRLRFVLYCTVLYCAVLYCTVQVCAVPRLHGSLVPVEHAAGDRDAPQPVPPVRDEHPQHLLQLLPLPLPRGPEEEQHRSGDSGLVYCLCGLNS